MTLFTNARGGGAGGDLNGVLSDIVEAFGLAYNGGVAGAGTDVARATRIGGLSAEANIGTSAFWTPDGLGGIYGAYALANQLQLGNTRVDPRGEQGRTYRHYSCAVPLGWVPADVVGGMSAMPYNFQAEVETVVRKAGTAGIGAFAFGFATPNADIFTNTQGAMGFMLQAAGGATTASTIICRATGQIGPNTYTFPVAPAVDVTTAPVRLKWRVTWGTIWVAELFVNDVPTFTADATTLMGYHNLQDCLSTEQLWAYPVIYAGTNPIAGPYWSRSTVRLVSP